MGEGEDRRAGRVVRKTDLLSVAFGVRRPAATGRRLPAGISRTLRRDGIVFEHLRYWHPIFSQWLARRERLALHFDPRNLSRPYVPHERDYPVVPFSDLRMPAVSGSRRSSAMPPCHRCAPCLRSPMKAFTSPSVQLRPRDARAWPERAPGTRQGASGRASAHHTIATAQLTGPATEVRPVPPAGFKQSGMATFLHEA